MSLIWALLSMIALATSQPHKGLASSSHIALAFVTVLVSNLSTVITSTLLAQSNLWEDKSGLARLHVTPSLTPMSRVLPRRRLVGLLALPRTTPPTCIFLYLLHQRAYRSMHICVSISIGESGLAWLLRYLGQGGRSVLTHSDRSYPQRIQLLIDKTDTQSMALDSGV